LTEAELDVLESEARRMIGLGYGALFADLGGSFRDQLRWSALGEKCRQVRERRGLDVHAVARAARMPRYRVQAIESGRFSEVVSDLAARYFHFLGIEAWVRRWARANPDLATRVGISLQAGKSRRRGHEEGRAI
jgi:transcriptional regulator with XRE-family HTH domain